MEAFWTSSWRGEMVSAAKEGESRMFHREWSIEKLVSGDRERDGMDLRLVGGY